MDASAKKQAGYSAMQTAKRANLLSLLTSGSTLICCALPATLVAIGSAATLVSLVAHFPQLIWISEHKPLVFGVAAVMLAIAGFFQWRASHAPCPVEPHLAAACTQARKTALRVYWISLAIFMIGVFFAFIAPLLS